MAHAQICGIQSVSSTDEGCFGDSTGSAVVTMDTTGTPPYSYSWNTTPVQTDSFATGLVAGTYTVTVTDDSGCVDSVTVIITEPPLLVIIIDSTKNVSCFGISDGVIYSSATGGTSPLLFSIDTGATFQASGTFDSLAEGAYSIIVRDSNGCSETTAVTITQPPLTLTIEITDTTFAVCGDSNGTATGTPLGGTPPFTYLWDDPLAQTDSTADSLAAGRYSIWVTDSNGCIAAIAVNINDSTGPTATISSFTPVACFGDSSGSATVTHTGGNPPYTYLWDDPLAQTDSIADSLPTGVYTVTVTDFDTCKGLVTVFISQAPLLIATITDSSNTSCNGDSNGTATVTVTGGTNPYTYLWDDSTAQTNTTATGLPPGTYKVIVTDTNSCKDSATVTINDPAVLSVAITGSTNVLCNGDSTATATATPTGGTIPYFYLWDDPGSQTTPTASGLPDGTYQVIVNDVNGCTDSATVTVTQPTALSAIIADSTNVLCNGDSNGSATVTTTGGTIPYTWLWDDPAGQTDSMAINLAAGTYSVTVTDSNGCIAIDTVYIIEPVILTIQISLSCEGFCDGIAIATPVGGKEPYTYLWDDSLATTDSIANNLCAGVYSVIVTDSNACIDTSYITVTAPLALVTHSDVTCNGSCDGTGTAIPSGGIPPYLYQWFDSALDTLAGETDSIADSLCAGAYSVKVKDSIGCLATNIPTVIIRPDTIGSYEPNTATDPQNAYDNDFTTSVTINVTQDLVVRRTVPVDSIGVICSVWLNVQISGTGIGTPLDIHWMKSLADHGTSHNFAAPQGVSEEHHFDITAERTWLWSDFTDIEIHGTKTAPPSQTEWQEVWLEVHLCYPDTIPFLITITEPDPLVKLGPDTGICKGDTIALNTSNFGFVSYLWNNGITDSTIFTDTAGVFSLTVADTTGCVSTDTIEVFQTDINLGADTTICQGDTVALNTGNFGFVSYSWNNGQTDSTIFTDTIGVFILTVTDSIGCIDSDTYQVFKSLPVVNLGSDTSVCQGAKVDLNTNNFGYLSYLWNNGLTDSTFKTDTSGVFILTVTDIVGCTATDTMAVVVNLAPAINLGADTTICQGDTILLNTSNFGYATYLWNNGMTDSTIATDTAGLFSLTVTDAIGCANSDFVQVFVSLPVINLGADIAVCQGDSAALNISNFGFSGYSWNNGLIDSTITTDTTGIFILTVTNNFGCTASDTIAVDVNPLPSVSLSADTTFCKGGSVMLQASGGVSYLWNPGTGLSDSTIFNPIASPDQTTAYSVAVTDSNGCTASGSIVVTVNPIPAFNLGPDSTVCTGDTFTLTAPSGYVYLWSTGDTIQTIIVNNSNDYWVKITDSLTGCYNLDTINVQLNSPPIVNLGFDTTVCGSMQLDAGNPGSTYLWSTGDTIQALTVTTSDTFRVDVTNSAGCTSSDTVVIATITLSASINFTHASCTGIDDGAANVITAGGSGSYFYGWSTGDSSQNISGLASGTYIVSVTDITYNCAVYDTVKIIIIDSDSCLNIPTVFTPNDDGLHDEWIIRNTATDQRIKVLYPDCTVEIYNRWGALIFSSNGYDLPWGGKFNSKPMPVAAYYYIIKLNNGEDDTFTGTVTIMR